MPMQFPHSWEMIPILQNHVKSGDEAGFLSLLKMKLNWLYAAGHFNKESSRHIRPALDGDNKAIKALMDYIMTLEGKNNWFPDPDLPGPGK